MIYSRIRVMFSVAVFLVFVGLCIFVLGSVLVFFIIIGVTVLFFLLFIVITVIRLFLFFLLFFFIFHYLCFVCIGCTGSLFILTLCLFFFISLCIWFRGTLSYFLALQYAVHKGVECSGPGFQSLVTKTSLAGTGVA